MDPRLHPKVLLVEVATIKEESTLHWKNLEEECCPRIQGPWVPKERCKAQEPG